MQAPFRSASYLIFEVTFTTQDASGIDWSYGCAFVATLSTRSGSPSFLEIPALNTFKLEVTNQPEEYNARIAANFTFGDGVRIGWYKKGTENVAVHLEVLDANGKVVHTQDGDLEKFGFT